MFTDRTLYLTEDSIREPSWFGVYGLWMAIKWAPWTRGYDSIKNSHSIYDDKTEITGARSNYTLGYDTVLGQVQPWAQVVMVAVWGGMMQAPWQVFMPQYKVLNEQPQRTNHLQGQPGLQRQWQHVLTATILCKLHITDLSPQWFSSLASSQNVIVSINLELLFVCSMRHGEWWEI